jgi:hypothetical protein
MNAGTGNRTRTVLLPGDFKPLQVGVRDGTRTRNPLRRADFKSAAYTSSATLTQ